MTSESFEALDPVIPIDQDYDEPIVIDILTVRQFLILSILSIGFYQLWWIYKSWKFFQNREGFKIHAAIRTILSIIYLIPLFRKILVFSKANGYPGEYFPVLLFIGFLFTNALSYLPGFLTLLSFTSVFLMIPPFKALNYGLQHSPDYIINVQTQFNQRQKIIVVAGIILWVFLLIGLRLEMVE